MTPRRSDTVAESKQIEMFSRMSPQQRLDCCFRWTELTHDVAGGTIRKEHPDWTDRQVAREIGRRICIR